MDAASEDSKATARSSEKQTQRPSRLEQTTQAKTAQDVTEGEGRALSPSTIPPITPVSEDFGRLNLGKHAPSTPGPVLNSPASQIFERSVQEDLFSSQPSPSIPSHIVTENHIPPILDDASAAITDERLDPDSVEIVTHGIHQPAALTVGGLRDSALHSPAHDEHPGAFYPPLDSEDSASNAGAIESTSPQDIKRLSFISFADLVHAEQAESGEFGVGGDRNSMFLLHQNALPTVPNNADNRLPSPVYSPISSSRGLSTSPPTSISPPHNPETSPSKTADPEASPNQRGRRRRPGSPLSFHSLLHSPSRAGTVTHHSGGGGSELNVETMRQALRRMESGDLSIGRVAASRGGSTVGDGERIGDGL